MLLFDTEHIHQRYREYLKDCGGEHLASLYDMKRKELEEKAKITEHIPNIAYKEVMEISRNIR